jgi:hypothetical protein
MDMSDTLETKVQEMTIEIIKGGDTPVTQFFSSPYSTPETDAVTNRLFCNVSADFARKLKYERDEARNKYDNLATEHMLVVNKLCKERDDARDALSRIDEIFCDGEDTHDDWMKMGSIAKDYFKGLE